MVAITLPDGSVRQFDKPVSVAEVAASIGPGLAKAALGGKVDGKLVDTSHRIEGDAKLAIVTDKDAEGLDLIRQKPPAFCVVDMRLDDGNGLDVIAELARIRPDARTIVLTGYGNFATAVSAVKLGAVDYLAKPADADDVTDALLAPTGERAPPPENPMSADRVRWEHIQRVYELCGHNVSETARRLNMHRRTLQRILAKRSPR